MSVLFFIIRSQPGASGVSTPASCLQIKASPLYDIVALVIDDKVALQIKASNCHRLLELELVRKKIHILIMCNGTQGK